VKGALRPSNAKRLYTDGQSTEKGETIAKVNRKVKGRNIESKEKEETAATLSDLYPSSCLAWVAVTGV